MAFRKYANASVVKTDLNFGGWDAVRNKAASTTHEKLASEHVSKVVLQEFNPKDFLLTHVTIIASVDTEESNQPLGTQMVNGFQINRKYSDYLITPETSKFVNNNCCVPGTQILMGDGTEKPIEEVVVGDRVVTHTGAIRQVTETFIHPFKGHLRSIKRLGDQRTLDVTPEHPVFAMTPAITCACGCGTALNRRARKAAVHRFHDFASWHSWRGRQNSKPDFTWVSAGLLDKGDFLSMPRLQGEIEAEGVTPGKARLLGYYLAEGFYHRQKTHRINQEKREALGTEGEISTPVGVNFALNLDETDTLVADIQRLLMCEFGVGSSVNKASENGVTVHSHQSIELVQFFRTHATEYAKTKKVKEHVLHWPLALQRELVQAWVEGDGCVEGTAGGWVSVASASTDLISQMHLIFGRLGVFATRHKSVTVGRKRARVANGGVEVVNDYTKTCTAHKLQVGSVHAEALLGGSFLEPLFRRSIRNRRKHTLEFRVSDQRMTFPIRSVTKMAYEGKVYNFETEVDHSYVANGVAVHNSDSWERKLLLSCYRTFIGGQNFCFVPGTMIQLADGTQKAIETIEVGDEVLTHEGRNRRVVRTFKRDVEEEICSLYIDRYKTPIKCTKNHPFRKFAVKVPSTVRYQNGKESSQKRYRLDSTRQALRDGTGPFAGRLLTSEVWAEAGSLARNDFVLGPSASCQEGGDIEKATLLGYYLSEGCLEWSSKGVPCSILLSFGDHEQHLADHAVTLAKNVFGVTATLEYSAQSVIRVRIAGPGIGAWFLRHGGEYSEGKRISAEVMGWSKEALLAVLAGWVTGDAQRHKKTERVVGSTVSHAMACQMMRICDITGVKASLWVESEASFEKRKQHNSYVTMVVGGSPREFLVEAKHSTFNVIISRGSLGKFKDLTPRWNNVLPRATRKRDNFTWVDGKRAHTIAWAGVENYRGPVYNFEVEEDNSYVLGLSGVAVHNCEHIQIPELSKGRIIDAAARDLGDTVYVDLLVATNRKHRPLIAAISNGTLKTLSMGAQVSFTTCSKCGNVANDETQLCPCIKYAKGNTWIDDQGKKRITAELCGHLAEPDSCKFIEASWVANPAFTGAVLRSILTQEEQEMSGVGNKMSFAFNEPHRIQDPNSFQKAAFTSRVGDDANPTQDTPEPKKTDDDPVSKAVGDLVDLIRERAIEKVRGEITKDDTQIPDPNQNDSLIKSALKNPTWAKIGKAVIASVGGNREAAKKLLLGMILYRSGGWKAVTASESFSGKELLALSRVLDKAQNRRLTAAEDRIYEAIVNVGGLPVNGNTETYLRQCQKVMGRSLTASERSTLVTKGRLYALGS